MDALYISDSVKLNEAVEKLSNINDIASSKDLIFFSQTSGIMSFPYSSGSVGNAYYKHAPNSLSQIIVDTSFRLFQNSWSLAFMEQLNNSLEPDGKIILPFHQENEAKRKGFWSLSRLQDIFTQKGKVFEDFSLVQFVKNDSFPKTQSLLNWYFIDGGNLLAEYMHIQISIAGIRIDDIQHFCHFMLESGSTISSITERNLHIQDPASLSDGVKAYSYWLTGLNHKSALMGHIIQQYFSRKQELTIVDQGGGPGLLVTELLLNKDLNIVKAVNCDISLTLLLIGRRLYSFLKNRLTDCPYYWLGPAEEYEYAEECDIVSFVGSLMYVPRDKVRQGLDRAWSALKAGGILIVHENIKADSYRTYRDYNMMFTVDELEDLLRKYDTSIHYYLSTATVEVSREQAGSKSVFRVLKKAKLMKY